jgi:hypothetical protein
MVVRLATIRPGEVSRIDSPLTNVGEGLGVRRTLLFRLTSETQL